jgi:hypothetical protein
MILRHEFVVPETGEEKAYEAPPSPSMISIVIYMPTTFPVRILISG